MTNKIDHPLQSIIIIYISRFLLPFIFAFGIYVQVNSSDSPGGGFQAGVLMASALILHSIVFGAPSTLRVLPFRYLLSIACFGMSLYLLTGTVSSLFGKTFLDYGVFTNKFIKPHLAQELGIFLVELGVGLAVFSTICIIYYSFIQRGTRKK